MIPVPKAAKDLTGIVFGRLTVLYLSRRVSRKCVRTKRGKEGVQETRYFLMWRCACVCGTQKDIEGSDLKSGAVISCGCYRSEITREKATKYRMLKQETPASKSSEYRIWLKMKDRCDNPKCKQYRYYGGRGIGYAQAWKNFETFFSDMGPRPSRQHSIDRIDNDGPYSPENCRWATTSEQAKNKRDTIRVTYLGVTKTMSDWAAELGLPYMTVYGRFRQGWPVSEILSPERKTTWQVANSFSLPKEERIVRNSLEGDDRRIFLEHYGNRCGGCDRNIDPNEDWIDDHIVPIAAGGDDSLSNRCPLHAHCAAQKRLGDHRTLATMRWEKAREQQMAEEGFSGVRQTMKRSEWRKRKAS